ncbi:MAG: ABC transporter ATP-binding protein, partial [Flavobacteriales bacterium]|nr:ABC transporter ATP-binding protein [Flavobacteriales bacterium]
FKKNGRTDGNLRTFGTSRQAATELFGRNETQGNLMVALLHSPEILILDEPTVGIDVHSRHMINTYLKELNQSGMTIIYTSHQLDETEKLCDRVCIIDHGKVITEGNTQALISNGKGLHDLFIELTGNQLRDK